VQEYALRAIEESWQNADVFVVGLSVGSGKSRVAMAIAKWQAQQKHKTAVIAPNRLLVEQYIGDFPRLHTVRAMDSYSCQRYEDQQQKLSCKDARACSKDKKFCPGCPYMKAVRSAHAIPYGVYNFHVYLAHKLFPHTLIIDEAHNTIPLIQEMAGRKLWHRHYGFPSSVRTYGALLRWLEKHPQLKRDAKLQTLHAELTSGKARYLVQRTTDLYHGQEEECLKLLPIDISDQPPLLWPTKVKKLVLMSATLNRLDIEQLGLDKRRVRFINAPSPIPVVQRPIIYDAVCNMSFAHQDANLPVLAEYILKKMAEFPGQKGMVHLPYNLAEKLRDRIGDNPRLIFHTRDNKSAQYRAFREAPPDSGMVLVGSGMFEGIDLLEDAGRFQIIGKIPFPSLAEPAIAYQAETNPEAYAWSVLKLLAQASGRVCRGPQDWGHTFIADTAFKRLYDGNIDLVPLWFKEAVQ
jgi:Rad3-related DNA helicase